jgi:ATP/maltotriose-dependent transcriptional regulator MalT
MISVDHARRMFTLHPMDADFSYANLLAEGPQSCKSLEIRVADWYAQHHLPRESWRTADDVNTLWGSITGSRLAWLPGWDHG